jgi:hypothetical protein
MTYAQFVARFGDMASAPEPLFNTAYAEACDRCDATVWGDKYTYGVQYLTAHLIAISPFGQQARMVSKDGSTTYGREYERIRNEVAIWSRAL